MDQLRSPGGSDSIGDEGAHSTPPSEHTPPPQTEASVAPELFERDVSPQIKTGLAKGLSMMWQGTSQWSQYDVPSGEEGVQIKLLAEEGQSSGYEADELVVNMRDGDKLRTLKARVRTNEFHDPVLNTSDYDWAPRYPESAIVLGVDDIRTVRLEGDVMVSSRFTIERPVSDTREPSVSEGTLSVMTPLTDEEAQGIEIEWDWEGDLVDSEPNAIRYSKSGLGGEWRKTYGYRNKRGFNPAIGGAYKDGEYIDVSDSLTSEQKAKVDVVLTQAGNLASPPHENLVGMIGKEVKRKPFKSEQT